MTDSEPMESYIELKEELLQVCRDIPDLLTTTAAKTGLERTTFDEWHQACSQITAQLGEEVLRVAVVGPVKSGKSTLTNALLKGDYLKRGAGVVTSIVTRVRRGTRLTAKLYFKNWDEIKEEIHQALYTIPDLRSFVEKQSFDIQSPADREALQKALTSLKDADLVTNTSLNRSTVVLTSYLRGYAKAASAITPDASIREFSGGDFKEHGAFVGDDALAVYLNDIELEIESPDLGFDIEIADCQGSDSPNPLHLAKIQDYLASAHLLLYVISSRTGIRQADIKLLSIIKKMGILDNILFVVNVDFNEHESTTDLNALIEKVKEDLRWVLPHPDVYAFSALYHLFNQKPDEFSSKDRLKLQQWSQDQELTDFSDRENNRFYTLFVHKLRRERYLLHLKSHVERLANITTGIRHWIRANRNILSQDAGSAHTLSEQVSQHRNRIQRLKLNMRQTLDGAEKSIVAGIKADTDRFFDARSGEVMTNIKEFIRGYHIASGQYREALQSSGFNQSLALAFQDFKEALDVHMAESVTPVMIHFLRDKQKSIGTDLQEAVEPYESMIQSALADYHHAWKTIEPTTETVVASARVDIPDMESLKNTLGIDMPPAVTAISYTNKIKTEAVVRLGMYTIVRGIKKLFRKSVEDSQQRSERALRDAVARMKKETEKSLDHHFKDYRENVKFSYLIKLARGASAHVYGLLTDSLQAYVQDFTDTAAQISKRKQTNDEACAILTHMLTLSDEIDDTIQRIRTQLQKLFSEASLEIGSEAAVSHEQTEPIAPAATSRGIDFSA